MAIKVETFRSISGKSHDRERDAWIDDLTSMIYALVENAAMTDKVVSGLISNPGSFREALGAIDRLSQPQLEFDPIPDSIKPGHVVPMPASGTIAYDPINHGPALMPTCPHGKTVSQYCIQCVEAAPGMGLRFDHV